MSIKYDARNTGCIVVYWESFTNSGDIKLSKNHAIAFSGTDLTLCGVNIADKNAEGHHDGGDGECRKCAKILSNKLDK